MQLVEIVQKVLETRELTTSLERQIQKHLEREEFTEAEITAIDQLIDALCKGTIRSVPDSKKEE
ncbi:hypothetical protein K9N68_16475 [Kovacikia minuta CCNUW1]|uniref:hypothetical protein n=1 Tax=Kovacikia minuta TaxID=2931930 RepID=UPI001CCEE4D8|nr:hypothetical protein [Kovacikia minuta]UBF29282.1 hypothetical protein K9N68_16475 [Kovacikia minuta CCNUW1]